MATQTTSSSDTEAVEAFNEGVRAIQRGNEPAAVRLWEEAVSVSASMIPAARNLIVFHEGRGDYGRVAQLYDYILALDPYDTGALIRQAAAHRHLERMPEAIGNYKRAIAIYPYYRFWYDELATLLDAVGESDDAHVWRDRAVGLDSDEAEMAFEDGVRHLRARNFDLAVTIFEAVIEELPANLEARLRLAAGLQKSGREDEALAQLAQALELTDSAPALVHYERARLLLALGREQEAVEDLHFALDHDSTYGRARNLLTRLTPAEHHETDELSDPGLPAGPGPAGGVRHTSPHRSSGAIDTAGHRLEAGRPSGGFDAPSLPEPPEGASWLERVSTAIADATAVQGRTGQPGRVALLFEADPSLVASADAILNRVSSPDLGLTDGESPRIYVIEGEAHEGQGTHGIIAEGWLATPEYPATDFGNWGVPSMGIPIDRMLESASLAVGSDGFNCIVLVATGVIRGDQTSTLRFIRQIPTYRVVLVCPSRHVGDLGKRLVSISPNFLEIEAS